MTEHEKLKKHDLSRHFKLRRETIIYVIVALFFLFYAFALKNFIYEDMKNNTPFEFSDYANKDRIDIFAKFFTMDPFNEKMNIKLYDFIPHGNLINKDPNSVGIVSRNLKLIVSNISGEREYILKKNQFLNVFDTDIWLNGRSTEYPFDNYTGYFYAFLIDDGGEKSKSVPLNIEIQENLQGFNVKAERVNNPSDGGIVLKITATRSGTVKSVALTAIILMWAMGLSVIFMTMAFIRGQRIESLAFYSALLFALVGFRNSMPDTPPIGTLSDYLSFFWVMAIVAIMMVLKIILLLRRTE